MRIATYQSGRETALGVVVDDRLVELSAVAKRRKLKVPPTMLALIEDVSPTTVRALGREATAWIQAGRASAPVSRVKLLAPITPLRKNIFCVGRNYAAHAWETGGTLPE